MTEDQVAEQLVAWARAELTELQEGRAWLTAQKTKLPDVVADVEEKSVVLSDPRFPRLDIEQAALRVFDCVLAFMVAIDKEAAPAGQTVDQAETKLLRDFGARLEASLLSDGTLGGRVFMASPLVSFDYRLPFVQYEDGTRGRQMVTRLAVAEPVQAEPA